MFLKMAQFRRFLQNRHKTGAFGVYSVMKHIYRIFRFVPLLLCVFVVSVYGSGPVSPLQARQWREDLRYLAAEMPKVHKNLFHAITRAQFSAAVKKLDARIPGLSRNQIIVEFARIVAMAGDGHTRMGLVANRLGIDEKIGFRAYPFRLYLYKDGLFVESAAADYAEAVGGRVTKIGNFTADEAYKKASEITFRDNEMTVRDRTAMLLTIPELLDGLGLVPDMENAGFTVEKNGAQRSFSLKPVPKGAKTSWVDGQGGAGQIPLWQKNKEDNYWFEYLPASRTVYLQYNSVANKRGAETFADFCRRVFAFVEANPVDRFVIDLRHNEGGNSGLNWPLIYGLIRSDKVNQKGKLFTIIGRRTFSAAVNCADALERHTRTTFVGEPTGSSPNQYGDSTGVVLPNSGLDIQVSTLWHQEAGARDTRAWLAPEIAAELTSKDYETGSDPALNAIMNYAPEKPLREALADALVKGDRAGALKLYGAYKNNDIHRYSDTENEINNLGYDLMGMKRIDDAIEVFKWNVESYPNSWNAYDSLGEAYMNSGNKPLAILNYKRSLQLNPANAGAKTALRNLGVK